LGRASGRRGRDTERDNLHFNCMGERGRGTLGVALHSRGEEDELDAPRGPNLIRFFETDLLASPRGSGSPFCPLGSPLPYPPRGRAPLIFLATAFAPIFRNRCAPNFPNAHCSLYATSEKCPRKFALKVLLCPGRNSRSRCPPPPWLLINFARASLLGRRDKGGGGDNR
jgi:hypothetical protein